MAKRQSQQGKNRGVVKGRGQKTGKNKFPAQKEEIDNSNQQGKSSIGSDSRGKIPYPRGRGRGREFVYRCFGCNKIGHRSFECLENDAKEKKSTHIAQVEEGDVKTPIHEDSPDKEESLLMKRIFLNTTKEIKETLQIKTLFMTVCKVKGKCWKVVIDSASTNNLVSTKVVDKLGLKNTIHPTPYKVSWL
jgi:hypothetical protein